MRTITLVVWVGVALGVAGAELQSPEVVWDYDCGAPIMGSPVFYPSVETPTGVLVLTQDARMLHIGGDGKLLWEHGLGDRADASPAVGDLDGDGTPEIVTATLEGTVIALDGTGQERWRFPLQGKVTDWSSPCLPDIDGDGACEVVVGDQSGWMNCLSGDGRLLWRITVDAYQVSPPAFIPGGGGSPDKVIFGTENDHMAGVTSSGELLWVSRHIGQFGRTSPTAGDLDGAGGYEVTFITSFNNPDSRLWVLDANDGGLDWSAELNLHGYVGNAIADIEGDGRNEVILGIRSNTVYCFDGDGTKRWQTLTGGQSICWTPAVADVDGDGRCEVIAGTRHTNERGKSWFVLDDEGTLLAEYAIPGGVDGAPIVADVDGDGRVDIVMPGSTAGLVRCVTFGGPAQGSRRPWASHRYDAARLGCVPADKEAPVIAPTRAPGDLEAQWDGTLLWGVNALEVTWPSGFGDRAVLEVSSVDPVGRRTTRARDLPTEELPGTVPVDMVGAGRHHVAVRLWDPSDWSGCAYAWEGTVDLGGPETLAEAVRSALDSLGEVADSLVEDSPTTARLLRERLAQRVGGLEELANRASRVSFAHAPNADALLAEIKSFRAAVDEDLALARAAAEANADAPGRTIAAWEDPNPWDETPSLLEDASPAAEPTIGVPLYAGEYESRAMTVLNLAAESVTVQVRPGEEAGEALRFYEVIETPRRDGKWVPDALATLNSGSTLRLAPGEARRLWLTVNAKVLETGTTELPFELLAIGWREDRINVTVKAEVADLDLGAAPLFRVCNWSSPQRLRGSGVDIEAFHEAKEHGMNVFTGGTPGRRCDADGNLVGTVDWSDFDAGLELMGPDGFVLLSGEGVGIPEGVERFGTVHVKAQRAWLQEVAAHLESKGWGMDRWALYPVDEPGLYGGTRIALFEEIARHFREAMPEAPIYANPSGAVTKENMAGMVPLVDVWCPEQGLLRREPELATFFLDTGKAVWCYEAPPDVKTLMPLGYYRANSWMAYQLGLSGTGFWTQLYGGAHYGGNDMWLQGTGVLFGANYAAPGKEVISRRWEAFRDGIEDVRAFMMLRDAAETARKAGTHAGLVARADELLERDVEHATRKAWPCGDPTRFLRDYEMDYGEIRRIREETAELTRQLGRL